MGDWAEADQPNEIRPASTPAEFFDPTPQEEAAIKNLLSPDNPEARLVWSWLARAARFNVGTAVPGDPTQSDRNEGGRVLGLRLAAYAGVFPFDFEKRR